MEQFAAYSSQASGSDPQGAYGDIWNEMIESIFAMSSRLLSVLLNIWRGSTGFNLTRTISLVHPHCLEIPPCPPLAQPFGV